MWRVRSRARRRDAAPSARLSTSSRRQPRPTTWPRHSRNTVRRTARRCWRRRRQLDAVASVATGSRRPEPACTCRSCAASGGRTLRDAGRRSRGGGGHPRRHRPAGADQVAQRHRGRGPPRPPARAVSSPGSLRRRRARLTACSTSYSASGSTCGPPLIRRSCRTARRQSKRSSGVRRTAPPCSPKHSSRLPSGSRELERAESRGVLSAMARARSLVARRTGGVGHAERSGQRHLGWTRRRWRAARARG